MTERSEGFDRNVPSTARMYDHHLGSKKDFSADRDAAEAVLVAPPCARRLALDSRGFVSRRRRFEKPTRIQAFAGVGHRVAS